jgi:hypothetical protein
MQKPETREMYAEIASLVASVAKVLALTEADTIAAIERGAITLDFREDAHGNRYVAATYQGRVARVYQGAVKHAPGDQLL